MTSAAAERSIEYLPLDDIATAERNPKGHASDEIVASMREFGFTVPVLRDERTDRLIAGHGRLQALRVLRNRGEPPPDGIREDGTSWLVPVVVGWSSRDDAHADAMVVADNRLTEIGGWDDRLLAELLEDVSNYSLDLLTLTGYSQDDLARLIADTRVPDFEEDDNQPSLDSVTPKECPSCGYKWRLGPGNEVIPVDDDPDE